MSACCPIGPFRSCSSEQSGLYRSCGVTAHSIINCLCSTQGLFLAFASCCDATCLCLCSWGWRFGLAAPKMLFSLIKTAPALWLLVMIFYPVLSVYPQELLYRAYFFHRFKPLFGERTGMILASAMLFGFVHIIFGSWISIALTAAGGVLFGMTYRKSGSLLLACLEHALFGDFIFTIGIGRYFYHLARH